MVYPGVILLGVLLVGFLTTLPFLFYISFAVSAITSLSLLPPEAIGGLTLQTQSLLILALLLKTMAKPEANVKAASLILNSGRLGLLFAFLIVAYIISALAPSFFSGEIIIVPQRMQDGMQTALLQPSMANFTQCVYVTISVANALLFALLATEPNFLARFTLAVLIGGITVFTTGVVDLIFQDSGVLTPFRNASYAILESASEAGVRRVIGLTPEASAFGSTCVLFAAMLLFLRPAVVGSARRLVMLVTTFLLVAMAMLSTSSAAYLGLGAMGVCYVIGFLIRGCRKTPNWNGRAPMGGEIYFLVVLIYAGALVLLVGDGVYDRAHEMLDSVILKKGFSESYIGRSFWNTTSLAAFFSTNGMGVGVGSTRTSNGFLAILSNVGLIGAALYTLFIANLFLIRTREPQVNEAITGLKLVILTSFLPWAAAGSGVDFGANTGAIFGVIVGLAAASEAHAPAPQLKTHKSRFGRMTAPSSVSVGLDAARQEREESVRL